jgi:hypothetical protein
MSATAETDKKCITVWFKGSAMLVAPPVAEAIGMEPGHQIRTEQEFWTVLGTNASYLKRKCERLIEESSVQPE